MATYLAFHEVDDVEHWRKMPTRDEFFGPLGITHRTFRDPQGSNRVGLILEIPDFGAFQEAMQSDQAAQAMKPTGFTRTPSWCSRRRSAGSFRDPVATPVRNRGATATTVRRSRKRASACR
jgi:hypothetical protein